VELADPASLWSGTSRILRVKLLAADQRYLDAAHIALQHTVANPDSPNAAELLFLAVENAKLGGDATKAQAMMEQLHSQYPNSPFAHQ